MPLITLSWNGAIKISNYNYSWYCMEMRKLLLSAVVLYSKCIVFLTTLL